jgi:hypothetical protein
LLGVSGHGLDRLGCGLLGRAEAVFELAQPSARLVRGLVVGRPRETQGSEPLLELTHAGADAAPQLLEPGPALGCDVGQPVDLAAFLGQRAFFTPQVTPVACPPGQIAAQRAHLVNRTV